MLSYLKVVGPNKYRCTACDIDHDLIKPILVEILIWAKVDLEKRFEVGFELLSEEKADQELFLTSDSPKGRYHLLTRKRRYQTELSFVSRDLEQLTRKKELLQGEISRVC